MPCNLDSPDCRLPKTEIIRGRNDFRRVLQKGSHIKGSALSFIITASAQRQAGFIVPKRIIRKAVNRNRIKRWLREIYRCNKHLIGHVQILILLRRVPDGFNELEAEFKRLAARIGPPS